MLYDLNRAGVELARLHEHHRQVHKVAFNPHQGYLLLSGSQDATVRLWDLRELRKDALSCASRKRYNGAADAIRDLKWSLTDAVDFAFGTDSGVIQCWDYRFMNKPKLRIQAHDKPVNSIDWHLDGKHVLSASTDKTVRVWDCSSDVRRQKPAWVIRTPYSVHHARWRPPAWHTSAHEVGSWRCTQIATSYDRDHGVVHVWDFRRPFLPLREIHRYNTAPTDMLWHTRDLLWTVGREGMFTQNDVHFAHKVIDRRNMQAVSVSSNGEISGFTQRRPLRKGARLEMLTDGAYVSGNRAKRASPEKGSLTKSSVEEAADDGYLSSSLKRHHGRTASNRSAKSYGSTPPSFDTTEKVMLLQDSLNPQIETFKSRQVGFKGAAPGIAGLSNLTYLAQKYKTIALPDPPTLESFANISKIFEQNAEYARRASLYRQAQIWMMTGHWISYVVQQRAEGQRRFRVEQRRRISSGLEAYPKPSNIAEPRQVRAPITTASAVQASGAQPQNHHVESTSNVPTPLARPVPSAVASVNTARVSIPDPDITDDLSLPPAATGPHSIENRYLTPTRTQNTQSKPTFAGPKWFDSEDFDERRAMAGSYRAAPRTPLNLEPAGTESIHINRPPLLDRHNSDESFAMFSTSTDSQQGNSMASSFASQQSHSRNMEPIPEQWQESPGTTSSSEGGQSNLSNMSESPNLAPRMVIGGQDFRSATSNSENLLGASFLSPRSRPAQSVNGSLARPELSTKDALDEEAKALQSIETLRRNNQLLRHDSSESEAVLSSLSSSSINRVYENMEASGTIVPDENSQEVRSPTLMKYSVTVQKEPVGAPAVMEGSPQDESLLLSDYLATDTVLDTEKYGPFTIADMVKKTVEYASSTLLDAQSASILLLLITPLLPPTHPLSEAETRLIISTYEDVFAMMGMSPSQIHAVTNTHLSHLIRTGLNPFQAEAILATYHTQLHSLHLFNPAVSLRRLSYPTYPAVYESALKDTQLGLVCPTCKSPINNPIDKTRCESCHRAQAACPICWQKHPGITILPSKKKSKSRRHSVRSGSGIDLSSSVISTSKVSDVSLLPLKNGYDSHVSDSTRDEPSPTQPLPVPSPSSTLWTWCSLCGHGGHTACLSQWFADSINNFGACPTEGCVCDCVQGPRRDERLRVLGQTKAAQATTVRRDEWKVAESGAVAGATKALGSQVGVGTGHGGRKMVRVLDPMEGGSGGSVTAEREMTHGRKT